MNIPFRVCDRYLFLRRGGFEVTSILGFSEMKVWIRIFIGHFNCIWSKFILSQMTKEYNHDPDTVRQYEYRCHGMKEEYKMPGPTSFVEIDGVRKYKAEFMEKINPRYNQPWEY